MVKKGKDIFLNIITYLASSISFITLLAIIVFVFVKGVNVLSLKMIFSDYYEQVFFATIETNPNLQIEYDNDDVYYSKVWGIGLVDDTDLEGNKCVKIAYIDNLSPLKNAKEEGTVKPIEIKVGQLIKRIQLKCGDQIKVLTPKMGAESIASELNTGYTITELYYASMGGGIRGSLVSTLYLIIITLLIVMPIGIITAVYLGNYAKNSFFTKMIRSLIDMLSGIPSIIYGLIGVIIFIPFVCGITYEKGGSILSGALTMAIMLLPVVIKNTEEAIYLIPKGYKNASLALGASQTQTTLKIILPNALPGMLTAVLLSVGRIIGESAALIFAIGTTIQDDISVTKGSTSLAVHIWSVISGENPNYNQACAISIIILLVVLVLNILVKIVVKKINRFEVK